MDNSAPKWDKEKRSRYFHFDKDANCFCNVFYHISRDLFRHPHITTCRIESSSFVAKGHAYCSPQDRFNKKMGRKIARGRALKAIETKESRKFPTFFTYRWEFKKRND